MTTYTWLIEQMDCYPNKPQLNCVFNVHWRCNAVDETDPTAAATYCDLQTITYDSSETYTPYDQLTQNTVIEWVQAALGEERVAAIKSQLENQIANILTPPLVTPQLPWVAA